MTQTETQKAEAMVALLKKCEADLRAIRAEQLEARKRREQLAASLEQLKQIEAMGQRAARQRRRAAMTKRYGPYIFD